LSRTGPRPTRTASKTEGGTLKLGQARLEKIIGYGTDGGMVNFDDILTKEEINLMAKYIQNTPDVPPEYSFKDTMDSWKVIVPVKDRPTKQMNKFNLKNMFSVTLRDTGEVALIDGDTKEIRSIVKTGYAVHISRLSKLRPLRVRDRPRRPPVADRPVDGEARRRGRTQDRFRCPLGGYLQVQGL
jgi:hypothetical protein